MVIILTFFLLLSNRLFIEMLELVFVLVFTFSTIQLIFYHFDIESVINWQVTVVAGSPIFIKLDAYLRTWIKKDTRLEEIGLCVQYLLIILDLIFNMTLVGELGRAPM